MTAFVIRDLSKSYGGVDALTGVSFSVAAGERRVVIGPNGAGKTTLFHSISGTILPSSGSIATVSADARPVITTSHAITTSRTMCRSYIVPGSGTAIR